MNTETKEHTPEIIREKDEEKEKGKLNNNEVRKYEEVSTIVAEEWK